MAEPTPQQLELLSDTIVLYEDFIKEAKFGMAVLMKFQGKVTPDPGWEIKDWDAAKDFMAPFWQNQRTQTEAAYASVIAAVNQL